MAATGSTPIQLYNSSTPSAAPSAGNLLAGELAINTADEKLFFKNASNAVRSMQVPAGTTVGTSDNQTLTNKTISGSNNTLSNISLTTSVTGTLSTANGGTGLAAVGTNGQVLTSNGSVLSWQTPASSGVSTGKAIAMSMIFGF